MGETYIDVDVAELAARARSVRALEAGLADAAAAATGLATPFLGSLSPLGPTVQASPALFAAAGAAEQAHRSVVAECERRLRQVGDAMAHAADAYAHHDRYESHVILAAI